MKNIIKLFLIFGLAVSTLACNKEVDDFAGRDNFIISFDLTAGGVTYKGAVTGDQIVISIPDGLSLHGAVADVELSENATISPDPAQVTDWDSEEQFVVKSHNNLRKSYIYRIARTAVSTSGNVVLTTQTEVDAFAATGVSIIDGNLTIGNTTPVADTVNNLAALGALRQVVHNITILNSYKGENLAGLENLEKIGGLNFTTTAAQPAAALLEIDLPRLSTIGTSLNISSFTLQTLRLPELTFVGDVLNIKSDDFATLDLSRLASVGGNTTINAANGNTMETVSLPALETVGGTFTMSRWPAATRIEMPVLKSVGGLVAFTFWDKMETVSLPALETAGGINFGSMAAATSVDLPVLKSAGERFMLTMAAVETLFINALERVDGYMTLSLSKATGATFQKLESVGGFLDIPVAATNLVMPYFPALKYIGGELRIQNKAMTDMTGFPALEEIGKRLYLYNATNLTSISDLVSLKKIGESLTMYGTEKLNEIDIRGIEVPAIFVYTTAYKNGLKIVGDEVFNGTLNLGTIPSGTGMELPTIEGIKKYGGLKFDLGSNYKGNIEFAGIEEVTGTLDFTSSNSVKLISLPDLKKVGSIKFQYNYGITGVQLPELTEITGDFTYPVVYSASYGGPLAEVSMPKLETVGGNFSMTGITKEQTIAGLDMPLLKSVGGVLTLSGTANTKFTNVDNFSNLTSATGVAISGFTNLVDFTGFAAVIPALDATAWKISNCGYNPAWQDMSDEKYIKP